MADYKNAARAALGQGLGMGWGDEGEAWLRSKLGDEDYEDALKRIRSEYGHYAQSNPGKAAALEFAGGALPGLAAMLIPGGQGAGAAQLGRASLGAAARMAGTGAATGAIAGAGSAEEGNRDSGAITGGVIGGTLGLAVPAAMRGAGGAGRWLKERMAAYGDEIPNAAGASFAQVLNNSPTTIKDAAARKMSEAMQQKPISLAQISQSVADDATRGIPSVIANADTGLADLAQAVAQRTGKGAHKVEDVLAAQRLGTKERSVSQTNKALNPKDYDDALDQLTQDMKTRSDPAYQQAYAYGEVKDPDVLAFLSRPQFQQGLKEAQRSADVLGETIDLSKPTVEMLDRAKKGIDSLIEAEKNAVTGKLTPHGRDLTIAKNDFLKELDRVVPDYELARGIWSGGAELTDAMRKGLSDFGQMRHQQVVKLVGGMTTAEKEAFRTGVAQKLYQDTTNSSGNRNAAQNIIGAPEMQAKLQPLFDNPGEFKLFKAAMERESQLFQQSSKILGGSSTGKNIQMQGLLKDDEAITQAIGSSVTGGLKTGLVGMAMGALRKGQMTEKTADKLATMLMAKDPHEVASVVKLLEDYQAKTAPKAARFSAAQMGATTGSAIATAPAPSTYQQPSNLDDDEELQKLMTGPSIFGTIDE
jgi:hypothetical protein